MATDEQSPRPKPVGTGNYVVNQGDCIESIAYGKGFFWETLWNDSNNAELKKARKDPFVLLPGDQLHIPELRKRFEDGPTEQRHRFRRKGMPAKFRIVLLEEDQPRANIPYILNIDGDITKGTTDGEGKIERSIPPNARRGKLTVGEGAKQQEYVLNLGWTDPIDEVTGLQSRLANLGFYDGPVNGELSPATYSALRLFQEKNDLEPTGEADEATREKLKEAHGC